MANLDTTAPTPINGRQTQKATHFINLAFPRKVGKGEPASYVQLNPVRLLEGNDNHQQLVTYLEARDFKPTKDQSLEDEQAARLQQVMSRIIGSFRSAEPVKSELDFG